uniref:Uncharacterized protein n=1 Tax=Colletotrichum fructicola (strain Nara gc5) TaxID=1213859 RepID=L2FXN2_COLFN
MDAALAYASFLDFKSMPDAAEKMYQWALALATETASASLVDGRTYTINDKTTPPSENVLTVLTSIATHKARSGDERPQEVPTSLWQRVWNAAAAPKYPPPPDDGSRPPWRHSKELCEEASLNLYIGEILFATKDAKANREEGLAWTRDAVDLAEEQLRKVGTVGGDREARQTCRECLGVGLENWSAMVAKLAKEEEAKKNAAPTKSTFGFWSEAKTVDGRWAAEQDVVTERIRRTRELLVNVEPPAAGLASLLRA